MIYFYILAILFIVIGLLYYLYLLFTPKKNKLNLEREIVKDPNIAILIPARNESKVIEELLNSIEKQSVKVNPNNVFVIVESEKDSTIEIVKRHQMNYFVRKKLHKIT